jgi:hypothetical protein
MTDYILRDDDDIIDDMAIEDVSLFRLEVLGDNQIWLKLCFTDGRQDIEINLSARGKINICEV